MQIIQYFFLFILVEKHTISFKNYDIGFLCGIISMMKNHCRGSAEVPREMQYKKPKEPASHLHKKVKELFLYTESDFQHVQQLLKVKGRETHTVCMNLYNK